MFVLGNAEALVPTGHPIRGIKQLADAALRGMSATFDEMYAEGGRDSIPPERLLKAQLLMALYSVRSERQLCEQLQYNLLFRWFLDLGASEEVFVPTTFTKNRERLMRHAVAEEFFGEIVRAARAAKLMSQDHFTVDGTLIEAWASLKSFRPTHETTRNDDDDPGNPSVDFRGQRRTNDTHGSRTDPEAKLARKGKGKEAKLCFSGHALMENRNGLLVDIEIAEANGYAERVAAARMLERLPRHGRRLTLGADRGYDDRSFVRACREQGVTPHVAQVTYRRSAIDARTTRHDGYGASMRIRKRVEEIFGWMKTIGGLRRSRYRGLRRTQLAAHLVGAAYNLLRLGSLLLTSHPPTTQGA